jgi:hypothetical protein
MNQKQIDDLMSQWQKNKYKLQADDVVNVIRLAERYRPKDVTLMTGLQRLVMDILEAHRRDALDHALDQDALCERISEDQLLDYD